MTRQQELYRMIGDAFRELADIPVDSTTQPSPSPTHNDTAPVPILSPFAQRTGAWIKPFNITIKKLSERPDAPLRNQSVVYFLKDIWTTEHGTWDPSNKPGSIDAWAREAYLRSPSDPDYIEEGGSDHHMMGAVIGLDGKLIKGKVIRHWSDGFAKLGDPNYQDAYTNISTAEKSGWSNLAMAGSSDYWPDRQQSGPWCFCPEGASEVICGIGMPGGGHITTWAVWQAMKLS